MWLLTLLAGPRLGSAPELPVSILEHGASFAGEGLGQAVSVVGIPGSVRGGASPGRAPLCWLCRPLAALRGAQEPRVTLLCLHGDAPADPTCVSS